MDQQIQQRAAFSMIELIFVIMVLGIVASIGSQIIAKVYDSYLTQRALYRSSVKTELAATQLANRLAYSIPGTVIGRNDSLAPDFYALEDIPVGETDYTTLEWIGYDADGFGTSATNTASMVPVWSGYADVNAPTTNLDALTTPGSRLSQVNTIIGNLRRNGSTTAIGDTAILFPGTYSAYTIGYSGGAGAADIHPVSGNNGDTIINLEHKGSRDIKEHYKLAWTAYAIVPVEVTNTQDKIDRGFQAGDKLWDLVLHYDYQPWANPPETLGNVQVGQRYVLLRNVSAFKFTGSGNTIRFKICQRESIGGTYSINTCKEKAVIR
ncbi:MAG: prepilin-type N-terminal cleavage/methylation domain-containing protein [Sulfurimonas sp.]